MAVAMDGRMESSSAEQLHMLRFLAAGSGVRRPEGSLLSCLAAFGPS